MDISIFTKKKENLLNLINCALNTTEISELDRLALCTLLEIVHQYTYVNRLQKKGLLSHTIIDSLDLDYSYGEIFINFDNEIS